MTTEKTNEENSLEEKSPSFFWEIIKFAALAIIIVVPIRTFIAQPFIVNGSSMFPTFESGHYLIVDQLSYRFNTPERGDVVIFKYPRDPSKFFIKRIIGLPGETIVLDAGHVTITNESNPEGLSLEEPYIQYQRTLNSSKTLSDTEYFVMGDNRKASSDSRVWGPLPEEFLVGKALVRLFPFTQVDLIPGDYKEYQTLDIVN